MARKTVSVDYIRDSVNLLIGPEGQTGDNDCPVLFDAWVADLAAGGMTPQQIGRTVATHLLERVLFHTDNYKGYALVDGAQGEIDPTRRRYS